MKVYPVILLALAFCVNLYGQADDAVPHAETVYSQDDITKRTHEIGDVLVTGERQRQAAALTYSVLDSAGMEESANASFSELLSKHSTIFVKTYGMGSMATVSFRGTGASHTRVEWNGMPINDPMLGQVDFSQIPVWFADRVELYYGGSSMVSGSGALGGAVVINSAPKWDDRFYGQAVQSAGSYGSYQTFVSLGGGTRAVHAKVRYLYERAENNFSYKNISQPGHPWTRQKDASYNKHVVAGDIYWNAGRANMLSFNMWLNTGERNHPPLMSQSERGRRIETMENDDLRMVVGWGKHWARVRSKFTGGFQSIKIDYLDDNISAGNVVANTGSTVRSFVNRYSLEFDITERTMLSAVLNADYHRAEITDRKGGGSNTPDRFEAGVVAGIYHRFSDKLDGYALLRGELADGEADPLMPSLGMEYRPLDSGGLTFKLNGARNYHRPTLNDLYWIPGGNPGLKPERGYTVDISAGYTKKRNRMTYTISLTGYSSWIEDWIVWEPAPELRGYWKPSNKKKVFSRGLESYASVAYKGGGFSAALSGNYAYTRSTNERVYSSDDRSKGKQLVFIPKHKASVMLDASYGGCYLWWVWSSVGERFTTTSNETIGDDLPAYDLHDVTLGYRLSPRGLKIDLQAKVNNLFGRVYRALPSRPMPGQYFTFLMKITF